MSDIADIIAVIYYGIYYVGPIVLTGAVVAGVTFVLKKLRRKG